MASFSYVVIDKRGREKKGSIEASDRDKVYSNLKAEGLIPISVNEDSFMTKDLSTFLKQKAKPRELAVFCRQMYSMLNAGVTVVDSLNMLQESTENKNLKNAIKETKINIEKGETMAETMRQQEIFPSLLINMVEAGEASGSLPVSFERMAVQFEKEAKLKGLINKAMVYPIVVAVVAVAVIIVMLTFIVPTFMNMFSELDIEMPVITMAIVALSNFVTKRWYILLLIIAVLVFAYRWYKKTPDGEITLSRIALKLPIFGNFTTKTSSARFARNMATLIAAGLPLVDSLTVTAKTISNALMRNALLEAKEEIVKGVALSEPLSASGLFPPMVIHMTKIGEETGELETMLEKLADYYDEEVEIATQQMMAALEPMIIIILAAIVGVILAAVMLPMVELYEGLGNL